MKVYLVGGAVRDQLLGRQVKDQDFVVVGSCVDEMLAAGFCQVGADFPVFLHPKTKNEYALARTERKLGHGYQGFQVFASPDVTLQEDLQRRDLTVNAMAIEVKSLTDSSPLTGQVIDYYGGLEDIKNKTLRHVSSAFSEDPLRVLRTARFYSRYFPLGFSIAEETLALMTSLVDSGELTHLSRERIWQESSRALLQDAPQIYWQNLADIGVLKALYPKLYESWYQNGLGESRRLQVLNSLELAENFHLDLQQRWALLMMSFLSPSTNMDDALTCVRTFGSHNKVPKNITQFALWLMTHTKNLANFDNINANDLASFIQSVSLDKHPERFIALMKVVQVWQLAAQQVKMSQAIDNYNSVTVKDIDPSLKGADIGIAIKQARIDKIKAQLSDAV